MRLAAYVLLGDPAWLVPSIESYYDQVTRIVASYDEDLRSWSGFDMSQDMQECMRLLKELDVEGKVVFLPQPFSQPDAHPQHAETRQRQASLDVASQYGDWVIQLDTDEVVVDLPRLLDEIRLAEQSGVDGLEYPARWIYSYVYGNWFLERATRRLRTWDAIPGPVAVRAGTTLRYARQIDGPCRRLRFAPEDDGVGRVDVACGILHFSMVRSGPAMHAKALTSGHAPDLDWNLRLRLWEEARRSPARAVIRSVVRPHFGSYRLTRLPKQYDADLVAAQTMLGTGAGASSITPGAPNGMSA